MPELDIAGIVRVLNAHGVRYVVIGGVAALVHDLPVPATVDTDVTPDWTGARGATGTGLVRIDGKLKTVQRAAWELSNGPLPPGSRALSCEVERVCARVRSPST